VPRFRHVPFAAAALLCALLASVAPHTAGGARAATSTQAAVVTALPGAPADPLLVGPAPGAPLRHLHTYPALRGGRLAPGWADLSRTLGPPHAYLSMAPHTFERGALRIDFARWSGVYLAAPRPLEACGGGYAEVTLSGGATGGQHVALAVVDSAGQYGPQVDLTPLLPFGVVPRDRWVTVRVPIGSFAPAGTRLAGVALQEWRGAAEPAFFVRDLTLHLAGPDGLPVGTTALTVSVDAAAGRHAISLDIYGLAGDDGDAYLRQLRPTLLRWGGNPTSRFNWRIGHAWNAARDYFYRNGDYGHPSGLYADATIARARRAGLTMDLTIPTLGWVAKDTTSFSFPDAKGRPSDGAGSSCTNPRVVADPRRTSVRMGPADMQAWVRRLQALGLGGSLRYLAMDNEPDLWGVTQYDVHPACTGYDEIYQEFTRYADAIKAVAPHSLVTGPVSCCWYYYWNSMRGDLDRLRHGGITFLPWFLQAVRRHDQARGGRTLDVLDVHYYPEGVYNDQADAVTAAWRLQETRSLWDPHYVDHSWINAPVRLIPRLQGLVRAFYPGTRVAISEWNWGAERSPNGALALADVLGIFGEQGLDMAAYWNHPPAGSPAAFAFQLYRDYDGRGAAFGETSVHAASSDRDRLSVYASVRRRDGHLLLALIDKMPATRAQGSLRLAGFAAGAARVYRYDATHPGAIVAVGSIPSLGRSPLDLPPYSLTLLDVAPAGRHA